ncbi:hypothetical protein PENARI_c006G05844 [Penicillium arizonense]|uniref:Transcription factor domain-containing protein n=1 Tax=Penicillium arizonense TaxID=1835702 RepID=A0A1F5LN60_PENAI|nr:hypothetical protein PENARI_c006G05844 [Penicillium arizonense]OGE54526.1 hypothetical protein PENARI_c006G05844 [Penicillium arizonense]
MSGKRMKDDLEAGTEMLEPIRVAESVLLPIPRDTFEKLYLSPKMQTAGNLRRTFGNPTPIAFLGILVLGLDCTFVEPTEAHETSLRGYAPLVDRSGQSSSAALPERALCMELGDLFFTRNHTGIHSLFHKTSFLASLEDGSLPMILFLGCYRAFRSVFRPFQSLSYPSLGLCRPYVREAEKLLDLHEFSLVTIQACILLAAHWNGKTFEIRHGL